MRQGPGFVKPLIAVTVALLLFASLLIPAVCSADAPQAAGQSAPSADEAHISALVRQLGDASYAVRQRASKQLIELGIKTRPLLLEALTDDDAEVRARARQVLSRVNDADFLARLAAFENDLDGRGHLTLPCWDRFSRLYGQDEVARTLFVEMQRCERDLLEALDRDPKLASELFVSRVKTLFESMQVRAALQPGSPGTELGTACALIMVSGDEQVTIPDFEANQLFTLIGKPFESNLGGEKGPALKKMLGVWIVHNSSPNLARQNLSVAFQLDLTEGLELALKLLANDGGAQQAGTRQDALLAIGRWGNHKHIALVEPLLNDTSPCTPQQAGEGHQSQVRDVALAVLIHLSGQELKDYNLEHIQTNNKMLYQPGTIAFADAASRTQALEKWKRWAAKSDVETPEKAGTETTGEDKPGPEKSSSEKPGAQATPPAQPADAKVDATPPAPGGTTAPNPAQPAK
jgi:hypothetical protein